MSYGDFRKAAQYLDFPITEGELIQLMFRFKYILRPNTVHYAKFLNALFVVDSNKAHFDPAISSQLCLRSFEEIPISTIISHFNPSNSESKSNEPYNMRLSEMKEAENNINEEYQPTPFNGEIITNPNNHNTFNESKINENERKEGEPNIRKMEECKIDLKREEELSESKRNNEESKIDRKEESKSNKEDKRPIYIEESKSNREKEESKSNREKEENKSNREDKKSLYIEESKSNRDDRKSVHIEESKKSESKTNDKISSRINESKTNDNLSSYNIDRNRKLLYK